MSRSDSESRKLILEAAIEVFAERGLKPATVRAVGLRAGVNSALLYYYYENKEELYVDAVRFSLSRFLDLLQSRRQAFATGRERLAYLVNGLFDYYGSHPSHMMVVSTAVNEHPELMASTINSLLRERVALPFLVLNEGVQEGQLRAENPALMWWSILGVCLFAFKMRKVFSHLDFTGIPIQMPDFPTVRERIIDLLGGGLQAQTGSLSATSNTH